MQAYIAAPHHSGDPNWYPDSSATHHMTSNLTNINITAKEYGGSDQIRVGNGSGLSIKHVGTAQLSAPYLKFHLNNVLHVPQITKKNYFMCINLPKPLRPILSFILIIFM
jgi:hypothetical protein